MKTLIIALFLLSTFFVGRAQTTNRVPEKANAVMIIKLPSGKDIVTKNIFMSTTDIQSLKAIPSPKVKQYAKDANVAFFLIPKSNITLLTLPEFYNIRNIEKKYQNKISINGEPLTDTTNFLINDPVVKSIVKKDDGIDLTIKY
ncbi:hypothetical protein [Pedobacter cryoconitis]|uniref:hypothetical protein n=1 Tax=Pedobacter cryoconitis TaxID=188932 RepID=UPI0016125036|nr:hypothetical protein [Pedobacter cryoconitis]MBB5644879.1 hypothetical protein [Pedobacter cryoconitis]